jgi:2-beta-glucuronyltransferase
MKRKAVLFTGHYFDSRRKAGFHWIAEALERAGWEVLFFTAGVSRLSIIRRDYRLEYPIREEAGKVQDLTDSIKSFVWFTPWHPANLRLSLFNRLSRTLFERYDQFSFGEAEQFITDCDLCLFESTPAIMLAERVRELAPKAKLVYRVSDDLRLLRNHPVVLEKESQYLSLFDLVSVPSQYIHSRFGTLPKLKLQRHGIHKEAFDGGHESPYGRDTRNLVFVGNAHCDTDFLERAGHRFPELNFHIIGPIKNVPKLLNVHAYGELPHSRTVPYIKHADIGLHTLAYRMGAESFTDSLKVIQYSYCRLPIVAPDFLRTSREHMFYYEPGDDRSIESSLKGALALDRSTIDTTGIASWDELTEQLCESCADVPSVTEM